jgi:hypothetical protein
MSKYQVDNGKLCFEHNETVVRTLLQTKDRKGWSEVESGLLLLLCAFTNEKSDQ